MELSKPQQCATLTQPSIESLDSRLQKFEAAQILWEMMPGQIESLGTEYNKLEEAITKLEAEDLRKDKRLTGLGMCIAALKGDHWEEKPDGREPFLQPAPVLSSSSLLSMSTQDLAQELISRVGRGDQPNDTLQRQLQVSLSVQPMPTFHTAGRYMATPAPTQTSARRDTVETSSDDDPPRPLKRPRGRPPKNGYPARRVISSSSESSGLKGAASNDGSQDGAYEPAKAGRVSESDQSAGVAEMRRSPRKSKAGDSEVYRESSVPSPLANSTAGKQSVEDTSSDNMSVGKADTSADSLAAQANASTESPRNLATDTDDKVVTPMEVDSAADEDTILIPGERRSARTPKRTQQPDGFKPWKDVHLPRA